MKGLQFPINIGAEELYQDIEVDDMYELFDDEYLIENNFGVSIKVQLEVNTTTKGLNRKV